VENENVRDVCAWMLLVLTLDAHSMNEDACQNVGAKTNSTP